MWCPPSLVLLLDIVVIHFAQCTTLYDGFKDSVKHCRKLDGHRNWVFCTELSNVIGGRNIVHFPEVLLNVSRRILCAALEREKVDPTHATYNGVHLSSCTSTVKYHAPTEALYTGLLLGVHQRRSRCARVHERTWDCLC